MVTAWRIVKARHAGHAFDGQGAARHGGRWNSRGTRVVYTASSWSLGLLEMLVHLDETAPLDGYVVIEVRFDEELVDRLEAPPANWRDLPAPPETRALGDAWVASARSVVLSVPSTISPVERTYLLNPEHSAFSRAHLGKPTPVSVDPRLHPRSGRA
jgi:RES domain-containing protein